MSANTSINLKKALIDTLMAGLLALIVFGPIVGVVLQGYEFRMETGRVAWMVGCVMVGRLLLSIFLQTARGQRILDGLESTGGGVGVLPPDHKSRIKWVMLTLIVLAVIFPFFANKYLLTVVIFGLI